MGRSLPQEHSSPNAPHAHPLIFLGLKCHLLREASPDYSLHCYSSPLFYFSSKHLPHEISYRAFTSLAAYGRSYPAPEL